MSKRTYLLDTNILLTAVIAPEMLPIEIQNILIDSRNRIFFSSASIWEIAIKRSLNKGNFDFLPEDIYQLALQTGFSELPIQSTDCYGVVEMPWHHRDPFDRLLIAQTKSIPAYFLTTDHVLSQYSDLVIHLTLKKT